MTSKERAQFRAQANGLEPEFQIGKGGMSDGLVSQTLDSFRTKELIKIKVLLDTSPSTPRELADELSEKTGSEVIQVIGGIIVLYKKNENLGKKEKKTVKKKTKPLANVKAKRALAEKKELEAKKEKRNFYAKNRRANTAYKKSNDR